jgi:putative ABC transport system permease protein
MRPDIINLMSLRHTLRKPMQSLLFVIGVAMGVATVIAIDIANDSASRAFTLSAETIAGQATHQVTGGPSGLPADLATALRALDAVEAATPVLTASVRSPDLGERPLTLLGLDPLTDAPFRDYLAAGSIVTGDGEAPSVAELVVRFAALPNAIVMSGDVAARYGFAPGDRVALTIGAREREATLAFLIEAANDSTRQALDDLLLTSIANAQAFTGQPGRVTRIDLILPDEAAAAAVTAALPPGAVLETTAGRSGALGQIAGSFEVYLQALGLVAVIVGVFLIYNTVTFSVLQRRPTIGVLRALGASSAQVMRYILVEAGMLGLAGTLLGLVLGVVLGRLMVGLVAQTISDLYFAVNVTSISLEPWSLLKGAAIGIGASIGTALVPALEAQRTPPVGALRRTSYEETVTGLLPWITLAGLVLVVAGLLLLTVPGLDLLFGFVALFAIVLGAALFTPLAMRVFLRLAAPVSGRLLGVIGRMAPRAVRRALSRTSVAVAALMVAVSVIVGVSLMISSFRTTVNDWLGAALDADIFVSQAGPTFAGSSARLEPAIAERLAAVPGVARVSAAREAAVVAPDYPDLPPVNVLASDFDIAGENRRFAWSTVAPGPHQALLDEGAIMVSEPLALKRGITPEQPTLTLVTDRGPVTFDVLGVYYDYTSDQGTAYMSRDTYQRYFDDPFITSMAAFVAADADPAAVLDAARAALADLDLAVQSNRELRASALEIFDRTFTITIALRLLATMVAFVGILSALMALQLEYTAEYGTMKAIGLLPGQQWLYTLLQTTLMGVIAGLMAIPTGIVMAAVLIYVINVQSFGWTMPLTIQPLEILTAFAVAVVAALLAGIVPAWTSVRMNIVEALRTE